MDAKLIQLIVNHLHDDTEALDSCSLVSHAWLQSSRSHRFRRITLALTRLIWDSELDELLEFLEGAKFVKEYVVELYLLGPAKYRGSAIGPRRLYRILDQLPVLRELYMVGGRFGGHGEPTFTPSRRFDLDRLTIRSCGSATEDTAYDFATFIDLFHTVDGMVAFDLVYNEPRSVGRGLPPTPASPLVVQSFWLFSPPSLILPILRSRAELPKLRKVAVDSKYLIKDPKELTLFRDFLSQNGAYIEKLYFDISEPFRYSENTGGFTLEGCTSLKAVHLLVYMTYDSFETDARAFMAAVNMLASLSPTTKEVTFHIYCTQDEIEQRSAFAEGIDWDAMDKAINRLPDLVSANFALVSSEGGFSRSLLTMFRKMMEMKLPSLKQRGVLAFPPAGAFAQFSM